MSDRKFSVAFEVFFQFCVLVVAKGMPPNHFGFVHITDGMVWKAAHEFVKAFVGFLELVAVHFVQPVAQQSIDFRGEIELRLSMSETRKSEEKKEEDR